MTNKNYEEYVTRIKEILEGDFTKSVQSVHINSELADFAESISRIMFIISQTCDNSIEEKSVIESVTDKVDSVSKIYELKSYLVNLIIDCQTEDDPISILNMYLHAHVLFPHKYPINFIKEKDRYLIFDQMLSESRIFNDSNRSQVDLMKYSEELSDDKKFSNLIKISRLILKDLHPWITDQRFLTKLYD